ncbi:MAG: hypothetical protein ACRERD_03025, partial [Candidatus Binatia bacterium]
VWQEVTEASNRPGVEEIRKASRVEVRPVRVIPQEMLSLLDRGEAEAIALAEEITADELLLDERAARSIAAARGLKIIGTAGLLVRAKQQGTVPLPSDNPPSPSAPRLCHHSNGTGDAFVSRLSSLNVALRAPLSFLDSP